MLSTLSPTEADRFADHGYVVIKSAFARQDALAMEQACWDELADVHGVRRDDRSTWRQPLSDLKAVKHSPLQRGIETARVQGVVNDLLTAGGWSPPRDWGRVLITFPQPGPWDLPTGLWHWDGPIGRFGAALNALFVVSFIGSVAARSGGTLVLAGSHRLLMAQEAALTMADRAADAATRRDRFHRSHSWLRALTGVSPSPAERVATFMDAEAVIDGVPLRVVELTGEPGDMVFCHPAIVHCIAPNCGEQPRFMRIRQLLKAGKGGRAGALQARA